MKLLSLAELRKEIPIGSAQADQGQFVDGPAAFPKMRRRSAKRKSDQV